jgi:hypothetical protein
MSAAEVRSRSYNEVFDATSLLGDRQHAPGGTGRVFGSSGRCAAGSLRGRATNSGGDRDTASVPARDHDDVACPASLSTPPAASPAGQVEAFSRHPTSKAELHTARVGPGSHYRGHTGDQGPLAACLSAVGAPGNPSESEYTERQDPKASSSTVTNPGAPLRAVRNEAGVVAG